MAGAFFNATVCPLRLMAQETPRANAVRIVGSVLIVAGFVVWVISDTAGVLSAWAVLLGIALVVVAKVVKMDD